jgi:hypothetical protein
MVRSACCVSIQTILIQKLTEHWPTLHVRLTSCFDRCWLELRLWRQTRWCGITGLLILVEDHVEAHHAVPLDRLRALLDFEAAEWCKEQLELLWVLPKPADVAHENSNGHSELVGW